MKLFLLGVSFLFLVFFKTDNTTFFIPQSSLHEGDIIFHTSTSSQSLAIQTVTRSPYSHMGIIFFKNGEPYVFEAIATVRFTPLAAWIKRGQGGRYVIRRLKNAEKILTPSALEKMKQVGLTFLGKPYDLTFEWSDEKIYCSELVWKIYERALGIEIGKIQHFKDFNFTNPIVAKKIKERFGTKIPMNEPVITPANMFWADQLDTVLK